MAVVETYPDSVLRVTPRDAATLALGAAAAGAAVTFSDGSKAVEATASDTGDVAFPSFQPPALVTASWSEGGVSCAATVQVVSRHYFELDELKAMGDETGTVADLKLTDARLFEARAEAVDWIERNAGRSFVPVACSETVTVGGGSLALLSWADARGLSCPTADVALLGDSMAVCDSLADEAQVAVSYVHGAPWTPKAKGAALELAEAIVTPSRVPKRATGESSDAGFLRFTIAGVDGATGIPNVDAFIKQWGRRRMEVA